MNQIDVVSCHRDRVRRPHGIEYDFASIELPENMALNDSSRTRKVAGLVMTRSLLQFCATDAGIFPGEDAFYMFEPPLTVEGTARGKRESKRGTTPLTRSLSLPEEHTDAAE